jgi:tetratricopeptide (TPR) repeat protein
MLHRKILKQLEENPQSITSIYNLGVVYNHYLDAEKALGQFTKLLALTPEDPSIPPIVENLRTRCADQQAWLKLEEENSDWIPFPVLDSPKYVSKLPKVLNRHDVTKLRAAWRVEHGVRTPL